MVNFRYQLLIVFVALCLGVVLGANQFVKLLQVYVKGQHGLVKRGACPGTEQRQRLKRAVS